MRPRSLAGNLFSVLIASVSLPALVSHARAQQPTDLPEVVVEAKKKQVRSTNTRLEPTGTASRSGVASDVPATGNVDGSASAAGGGITGASTTVITREQIERAPQATLAEILGREAGVQSKSLFGGVNGAGANVDVRGFGAAAPSNTLVLINGRRLNDWDLQGFDLSVIAKDSVERIEITRGNSGAVLYGDGAVGGVINIVTRSGTGVPNQVRVEGGIGSFAAREGNASASGSLGNFSYFVNGNAFASDGYRINNELEQKSVVGDFRWTFAKGSVYLNLAADDQDLRLPGTRSVAQLQADRRGTDTPLDYANKQGARATTGFTYMLAPNFEVIVDGGIRAKEQEGFLSFSYIDSDLTTKSLTPRANITLSFFGLPSRITTGIDLYDTDFNSQRGESKSSAPYQFYDGGQNMVAGYWMQTVSVSPSTDISGGGRIQWNKTTANGRFDPTAPGGTSCFPPFGCFDNGANGIPLDESETNHAWHFGIEQKVLPSVTLLGRLAHSFRVANIEERIGVTNTGVPTDFNLRTQQSNDWEVGARFQNGPFKIQSTYYDMRLTDEIHFNPITFTNVNLDPTRRRGVETIASWQMMKNVRLYGNLTYTDAMFREGPFAGNEVPLVARWTGNVGLSWNIIDKALTLDTIVRYVGERRMDNDQANFQPMIPSYITVDLQLGGQINQFHWSAGVANLFDVEYFDYSFASATTFGAYNAYPLPGRTFMVKAGTTW
jgi:iron complex outermembrane receptor protein